MLKQKLAAHKTRCNPLEPRHTEQTDTMLAQAPRKHGRLYGVRAKEEVEQSILDPACCFQRGSGTEEDVVV